MSTANMKTNSSPTKELLEGAVSDNVADQVVDQNEAVEEGLSNIDESYDCDSATSTQGNNQCSGQQDQEGEGTHDDGATDPGKDEEEHEQEGSDITGEGQDGDQDSNVEDGDGSDGEEVTPVDPALEESKETCISTCELKCKSESADKKDACVDLCFNQCAASVILYVEGNDRPALRSDNYLALQQQKMLQNNLSQRSKQDEVEAAQMFEKLFYELERRQPKCTTNCVARCV